MDEAILRAFETVPREKFAMPGQEGISYCDEDLPLGGGRCLMEPLTHARLIQAVRPKREDVALDIGGATGYSAAILSQLVTTVVAVECNPEFYKRAENLWRQQEVCNVAGFEGPLDRGCPEHAPYSLIFLNGAVATLPDDLLSQLSLGGRLVAVICRPGSRVGQATLIERISQDDFSSRPLFDASVAYLPGFEPRQEFVF